MHLYAWSAEKLRTVELPEGCLLVRFADSEEQLCGYRGNPAAVCDIVCLDCEDMWLKSPEMRHAEQITQFIKEHPAETLIAQCDAGIGRSRAVVMALGRAGGADQSSIEKNGTHNRPLYRMLCQALGCPVKPEPLVALAVRVKYSIDRLQAFLLSLKRQRYDNWRVLFHSDGPNREMVEFCKQAHETDKRIYHMETNAVRGHWGHKWRADAMFGIKPLEPKYVGMSNDDNYYTPGYLEQMVFALEHEQADLALCSSTHRYMGWGIAEPGSDLGAWLSSYDLSRDVPWSGHDFMADARHVEALKKAAKKIAYINKPLFIKN
jgi:hypothetical protein